MDDFPTWIPDCDYHSPTLLDLFISSDTSICSTMAFPPLGIFDDVTISIDFLSYPKRDAPFHGISYGYSCADWNDHISFVTCSMRRCKKA